MNEKRIRSVIPMLILLVLIFFLGSWLLRFLVAVLSTLLAIGLNGGAAWLRRRIRGGTYEDH